MSNALSSRRMPQVLPRQIIDRGQHRIKTVSKLYLKQRLGMLLSEEQIPQIVESNKSRIER